MSGVQPWKHDDVTPNWHNPIIVDRKPGSINRKPCVAELSYGLEAGIRVFAARAEHYLILGVAASEGISIKGVVGEQDSGGPAQGEDGCALVNRRATLEFFGGHEAGRAKHTAHTIGEWASMIGVEVNGVDFAPVEVVDHGAVVEVVGYPAEVDEFEVQVVHVVQQVKNLVHRQAPNLLEGVPDQFAFGPIVEEHRAVGRFNDPVQRGQRGVVAALGEAGGVSERLNAGGMVKIRLVVVNEAGGLDEVAFSIYLYAVGGVAGVLSVVVEGGEDVAVGGEEVGGGLRGVACCMDGHDLGSIVKVGHPVLYTKVLSTRILLSLGSTEIRRVQRIIEQNQNSFLREWNVRIND